MPIADQPKKAGQWLATFLLGSTAVAMGANAFGVLFNHTAPRDQMRQAYAGSERLSARASERACHCPIARSTMSGASVVAAVTTA